MNQYTDPSQQNTAYDEDEISLVELATTLGEEKKLIFGLPFVAGIVAIVVSLLLTPIFTAKTTLLPPQNGGGGGAAAALASLGGLAGLAGSELGKSLGNVAGGLPFTVFFKADGSIWRQKMGQLTPDDLSQWRAATT